MGRAVGTHPTMGTTAMLVIVAFTVISTLALLLMALALPAIDDPPSTSPSPNPDGAGSNDEDDQRPRLRLLSRLLFSRRTRDAITIDCLLLSVEQAKPGVDAPEGLPFTLELKTPDTTWFAERVEDLLAEWADDSRELLLELREDRGKVRTCIASGDSMVHLELSGAAGLTLSS